MKKIKVSGLVTVAVLLFLGVFFVANMKLGIAPVKKFVKRETGFKAMAEEVRTGYTSDEFEGKKTFININGLFARTIGQRECNDIILLSNGMLSQVIRKQNMTRQATGVIGLSEYVKEQGIPFLYVQAPYKEDKEDALFPTGRKSYANENADELLELLEAGQVKTLDLRPVLSETEDQINQYFFRTDHHWNFKGAFVGFAEVVKEIARMFPEKNVDMTYTQMDRWESHTLENWSLGSRGKRVGQWFAGTDDVTWYTPKFETKMSTALPKYRSLFADDFERANLRMKNVEEKDYFKYSTYCMYIGGDYPLVQHRNHMPVTDMKILLLKDSCSLPFQSYLSTMFSEIDVVDPRHLTDCSVAEYIRRTEPDLVMLMMNPSVFGFSPYTSFGEGAARKNDGLEEHLVWERELAVEVSESNNYQYASVKVDYGKTYTLSFSDAVFSTGEAQGVVTSLYNKTTKTILSDSVYDLVYGRENGGFSWTFNTPAKGKDELCLIFYAGIPGSTAGNGVVYKEVKLSEWK